MPSINATASIAPQAFPAGTNVSAAVRWQVVRASDSQMVKWADAAVGAPVTFADLVDGNYRVTAHRRHATSGAQVGPQAVSEPFTIDTQVYIDVPTSITVAMG